METSVNLKRRRDCRDSATEGVDKKQCKKKKKKNQQKTPQPQSEPQSQPKLTEKQNKTKPPAQPQRPAQIIPPTQSKNTFTQVMKTPHLPNTVLPFTYCNSHTVLPGSFGDQKAAINISIDTKKKNEVGRKRGQTNIQRFLLLWKHFRITHHQPSSEKNFKPSHHVENHKP